MRTFLSLKLRTQLKLSPQLQQTMRLLKLSHQELELELERHLQTNPLLELEVERTEKKDSREPLDETMHSEDKFDEDQIALEQSQNYLAFKSDKTFSTTNSTTVDKLSNLQSEETLQQYLIWQLELGSFSEIEKIIAAALIDGISEQGYLQLSLEEMQESISGLASKNKLTYPITISEIEKVLFKIQQFDPIGVGARNLIECLKIQLKALPPETPFLELGRKLLSEPAYLAILEKKDYQKLKSKLKISSEALKGLIQLLKSLDPAPGERVAYKRIEYIIPDVVIRKKNQKLVVELNMNTLPQIKILSQYKGWVKQAESPQDAAFLRSYYQEAKCLIASLNTRNQTLQKVAQCIVDAQKDFFAKGDLGLTSFTLSDLSKVTGLHESTLSRITRNKYIYTPKGVFELKYFLSQSFNSEKNETVSIKALRALIQQLIEKEPKDQPFNDDKIVTLLAEQGLKIARRTIAKYRKSLKIPNAAKRCQATQYNILSECKKCVNLTQVQTRGISVKNLKQFMYLFRWDIPLSFQNANFVIASRRRSNLKLSLFSGLLHL